MDKNRGGPIDKGPGLHEHEREMIRDIGNRLEYKEGQMINSPADCTGALFLIESGSVLLLEFTGEGSQVERIAGPGELLGVAESFCGEERNGYACAAGDVSLFSIDREDFIELLYYNPFLLKKILGILSYKMNMDKASVYGIIFSRGPVNAPKDSWKQPI